MFERKKFIRYRINLIKLFLFGLVITFVLETGVQASAMLQSKQDNCSKEAISRATPSPLGAAYLATIATPCQAQVENRQDSLSDNQGIYWRGPYWLDGNVCRERGADVVCLTPLEATKLRWDIPAKNRS